MICNVTTIQHPNGTVHKFLQNLTFHENISSLYTHSLVKTVVARCVVGGIRREWRLNVSFVKTVLHYTNTVMYCSPIYHFI